MNFLREAFSEKGVASSKRVLGGLCILTVLTVWCKVTLENGLGMHETDLAEMIIGTSGLLLGISSVTKIFESNERNRAKRNSDYQEVTDCP